ncbi:MAG: hypothetical protein CMM07_19165 [Rhodopirellula sp.]|nr:hypothetical protein [Rhodopirellula sp.]
MRRALAALVRQDERPMKQAILDFDQQRLAASEQLFIQAGNHVPRVGSSVRRWAHQSKLLFILE